MVLTGEQELLRQSLRRLLREKIAPLAEEFEEKGGFPWAAFEILRDSGFIGLHYDTAYGGGGGDAVTFCMVIDEVARVCGNSAMILANHELGSMPIVVAGSEAQKQRWLPGIAAGALIPCFALTEPEAGSDAAGVRTRALRDGDEYVITGSKRFISNADIADLVVVFAKTAPELRHEGMSAFILPPKSTPGYAVLRNEHKMGFNGLSACEVVFEGCRVPADHRLGEEGDGFRIAMVTLDRTRPVVGAIGVGLAQGSLDTAVEYARERKQFGRPIAEFQGYQFMLADMATRVEAARGLVCRAAELVDRGHPQLAMFGAMAKCFATDVAMRVTTDGVQALGGYGYIKEFPQERRMRQAKLLQIVEGTNQIQRSVIARALLRG